MTVPSSFRLYRRFHTSRFLVVLFSIFSASVVWADEEGDAIDAEIDAIHEEIVALQGRARDVQTTVLQSEAYLDKLATSPASLIGADLKEIQADPVSLALDVYTQSFEAQTEEIVKTMAADTRVHLFVEQIEAQSELIEQQLETFQQDGIVLQERGQALGVRLADYIGENPFRIARFAFKTRKVNSMVSDASEILTIAQDTLTRTGLMFQKLSMVSQAASGLSLSPSGAGAQTAPTAGATLTTSSLAPAAASVAPATSAPLYVGHWKSDQTGPKAVEIFFGNLEPGSVGGFMLDKELGYQGPLQVVSLVESVLTLKNLSTGVTYVFEPLDDGLFLKISTSGGVRRVFLGRGE